jgi:hypothetical protein
MCKLQECLKKIVAAIRPIAVRAQRVRRSSTCSSAAIDPWGAPRIHGGLLGVCREPYAELDESQSQRLQVLLHAEAYREIEPS